MRSYKIKRIKERIFFLKKINVRLFVYLNYFCKNIIRTDCSKIIPYKNAIIELETNARIYVGGGDIEIGCDQIRKSKTETRIRLRNQSIWSSTGGCKISYGSTIELLNSAILDTRYFTVNSFSTLVTAKKMVLGQDVMIGREVILYDSDFHSLLDANGKSINFSKPVILDDHVWVGARSMIMKGTKIGKNSVIGAGTIVKGEIPENVICHMVPEEIIHMKKEKGTWSRKKPEEETIV